MISKVFSDACQVVSLGGLFCHILGGGTPQWGTFSGPPSTPIVEILTIPDLVQSDIQYPQLVCSTDIRGSGRHWP